MLRSLALVAFVGAGSVLGVKCDTSSKCPKATPCCSQYGECGVGAFCLGGCDPLASFSLDACVPAPVCKDKDIKFTNLDSVVDISEYLGDPDDGDWVASGEPAEHDGAVLLTMPKGSVGTVLSSTSYMWYGNVKARMKTARGNGVITAFILFSDVKDEVDYEFVGADLKTAQTNYFWQGNLDYHNSGNITVSDTFSEFHDYEIRWTPDKIEWLIDGKVGRTQEKAETWNETAQAYEFPQTPARVQLSLWPGGLESNPQGTIDWAGGVIDWNSQDIKQVGYYYATIESVKIECYDGKDGLGTNDGKSYWYDDEAGTNNTVVDGDKDTVIASLQATGLDMDKGKKEDDDEDDDDDDDDEEDAPTVPGGNTGNPGNNPTDDDSSSDSDSGSDSSSPTDEYDWRKFDQGLQDDSGSSDGGSDGGNSGGTRSSASALAMIIAGAALYWM